MKGNGFREHLYIWWELRTFQKHLPRRLRLSHALRLIVRPDERGLRQMPDSRREIEARIKRLVESGSVDEGCGDVLDRLIDSWTQQQLHEIEKKYIARETMIRELVLQARDRKVAAGMPSRMLAAHRRTNVRGLRAANERLLGTTFIDDDEAFGWSEAPGDGKLRDRRA